MSYSLNPLRVGGYIGVFIGDYYRASEGGYYELDFTSYGVPCRGLLRSNFEKLQGLRSFKIQGGPVQTVGKLAHFCAWGGG